MEFLEPFEEIEDPTVNTQSAVELKGKVKPMKTDRTKQLVEDARKSTMGFSPIHAHAYRHVGVKPDHMMKYTPLSPRIMLNFSSTSSTNQSIKFSPELSALSFSQSSINTFNSSAMSNSSMSVSHSKPDGWEQYEEYTVSGCNPMWF